jgi:hypothetical protein
MVTAVKTFNFSSEILFLSIDLFNRYLKKIEELDFDFPE